MDGILRMVSAGLQHVPVLFLVGATLVIPAAAVAQGLTGALGATVKDEQDSVLPGARVTLSSPALIGGPHTATTNDRGHVRFPVLAPGTYTLVVELPPGFKPYRMENITIGAGMTLDWTPVLRVAGVAESLVVEGESLVGAGESGFTTRFGQEQLRNIPTRRYSMFDMIRSAPGVSATSPSSGSVNTVSSFGSGVNENQFLIDGTNFTCPCQGVSRAEPSVDAIQEIQIQSTGTSVEYGNMQGAVFNVVTKQGGDSFQLDAGTTGSRPRGPVSRSCGRSRTPVDERAGTSASGIAISPPASAARSRAIVCGSSGDTSTSVTTTASRAPIRRSPGRTSRTRCRAN